jgi:hypothetical protein
LSVLLEARQQSDKSVVSQSVSTTRSLIGEFEFILLLNVKGEPATGVGSTAWLGSFLFCNLVGMASYGWLSPPF